VFDDKIKPLGHQYSPLWFPNIFILARKKSGKTTILYNLLRKCINKRTAVFTFCSTAHKDPAWKEILKMFDERDIPHTEFLSIEADNGENNLLNVIETLKAPLENEEKTIEQPRIIHTTLDIPKEQKQKPRPQRTPELCFIFDDLGEACRNPTLTQLMKTNRHYKALVIILSQSFTDLTPSARKQIDQCLVFKGLNLEKLKGLYRDLDPSCDFETFKELYDDATAEKYAFLNVDTRNATFKRNFDYQYILEAV
jgi:hypothetical protein